VIKNDELSYQLVFCITLAWPAICFCAILPSILQVYITSTQLFYPVLSQKMHRIDASNSFKVWRGL